jgi:hypothetical protein
MVNANETESAGMAPRSPNDTELRQLREWLLRSSIGEVDDNWRESVWLAVFDDYCTDCPDYRGKLMVAVWGEAPDCCSIFTWDDDGNLVHEEGSND